VRYWSFPLQSLFAGYEHGNDDARGDGARGDGDHGEGDHDEGGCDVDVGLVRV